MVHIFASETDHFPPIKALFELVTSVTLSIFQQGRGSNSGVWILWTAQIKFGFTGSENVYVGVLEFFCKNESSFVSYFV